MADTMVNGSAVVRAPAALIRIAEATEQRSPTFNGDQVSAHDVRDRFRLPSPRLPARQVMRRYNTHRLRATPYDQMVNLPLAASGFARLRLASPA